MIPPAMFDTPAVRPATAQRSVVAKPMRMPPSAAERGVKAVILGVPRRGDLNDRSRSRGGQGNPFRPQALSGHGLPVGRRSGKPSAAMPTWKAWAVHVLTA